MEDGAFGFATALIYPPAAFATTEELIEAARAMAPYGGVYITHMRSEADQLLEAIDEAIRIGRLGGAHPSRSTISRPPARATGGNPTRPSRGSRQARGAGVDVQANMYPYVAGGTGSAHASRRGPRGRPALREPRRSGAARRRMRVGDGAARGGVGEPLRAGRAAQRAVLGLNRPEHAGSARRLDEIAAERGQDWIETAFDLVLAERQRVGTIYFMMDEENVRRSFGSRG
jgi:N-acyl-D-amino-acid deacylase